MSLANIQSLVLRMVVDPQFATDLYQGVDVRVDETASFEREISVARKIPQHILEPFQVTVAQKRLRPQLKLIKRSWTFLSYQKRSEIVRPFITQHPMFQNEWFEKIPEFLMHIQETLQESIEEQVINELVAFEKWIYEVNEMKEVQQVGNGYRISPFVSVGTFLLPADTLISDHFTPDMLPSLIESFGARSYLLAMRNESEVDLFEVNDLYYEFLLSCQKIASHDELITLAETLLAQKQVTDKTPMEMIEEFLELNILYEDKKEESVWRME